MRVLTICGVLALFLLISMAPARADDASGRWGVGAFMDYNVPTLGLRSWYQNTGKFGMLFAYVPSPDVTVEIEFHRSKFTDGSPETRTFVWTAGDGKEHVSPDAKSEMIINSLLVNALVRLGHRGEPFQAASFTPYVAVGGGFYRYKNEVSGLLWPGQKDALVLTLEPFTDQRYALGFNAGFGVEAFVIDNVAVDIRGRYNFVIGNLRPLEDWGIEETFPMQLFDIGAGLRFYFGGK